MAKQLLTCFLLFLLLPLMGQDAFERIYRSDSNLLGVDVKQTKGGDYLVLSIPLEEDNASTKTANVTRLSPKGDLVWSKDYTFDSTTQVTGTLNILPNGNFAFTTVELQPSMNKVLTVANSQGDIIWSKAYGRDDSVPSSQYDNALILGQDDEKIKLFSTVYTTDRDEPYMAGLDSLGNIEWAQVLTNDNWFSEITGVVNSVDTGFVVSGTINNTEENGMLIKTDSVGNIQWSRSYRGADPQDLICFNAIQGTPDSGYLVVGTLTNPISGTGIEGIIAKLDSLGNPVWAHLTETGAPDSIVTRINNVDTLAEGAGLVIAGRSFDIPNNDSHLWMMQINPDSIIGLGWKNRYSEITGLAVTQDGLDATQDGGAVFFASRNMDMMANGGIPYLAKVDAMGATSCEDTLSIDLTGYNLITDTLIWQVQAVDTVQERMTEEEVFSGFSLPTLSLTPPPPFCEGDPINVTFDATTENAVSYEWTPNGETTPSIVATEAGMYTVDIRIETDICFNLCDTVTITEIGPPMVEIIAAGSLCADGVDTLVANASGFVESFAWGTGENTPVIFIDDEGSYDVTASNFCGSSSASINLECIFDFEACFAVPNAFTPDGDDANDIFNGIISEDCASVIRVNKLKIWNRWGQVVFESENGDGWDGSHNGKEAPSDAYLYSLEVENTDEMEVRVITGDLVLIR